MDRITNYKSNETIYEVIVKYSGNIVSATNKLDANVEILSDSLAIVSLPVDKINELNNLPEIIFTEVPKNMYFMRFSSQRSICLYDNPTYGGNNLTGKGTIIGIIDSGIDIYNRDFINSDGKSRIISILDLSTDKIYTTSDINNALMGDTIDFYDEIGHGTAIAAISAGNGGSSRNKGIAPECELVIVKLGIRNSFARSTDIMRGLKFIKDIAEAENKPVSINIAYGTNDGPHDGTTLLDEYVNYISDTTLCSICIAVGNEGVAGHHYRGNLKNDNKIEINVDSNINSMYMSLWKSFTDTISVIITSPTGEKTSSVSTSANITVGNTSINILYSIPTPYSINTEVYFNFENPSQGIWQVDIVPISVVSGDFDVWLPVTEAVGNNTFFLNSDPNTTITIPSTAQKAISVGAYNQMTNTILDFSGRGYTRNTVYIKPDIVAPGYNVPSATLTGGVDNFTGTSFAVPHATGVAALLMQWGIVEGNDPFLYGERLKAFLQKGAIRYESLSYPNRILGYGRICFDNTMLELESSFPYTKIQQSESIISSNNPAYSNEYYDFICRKNNYIYDFKNDENIKSCKISDDFYALYINRDYYELNKTTLVNSYGIRQPYVLGLMDYEEALEKSGITSVQTQPYLNLRGNGVLIAIIDTGIDYKNSEFIYEDGTSKIEFIWDQSVENNTENLCFGSEYTNSDINRAINNEITINTTDTTGHGTALAELAAGRNGAAPDSSVLVVKLKQAKKYLKDELFLAETDEAFETTDLMLGVSYAYQKANELNMPLVVCLGVGTNQGGHSGQSALEEYLEAIAKSYGVCLCVPMGNEAISRHHAYYEFIPEQELIDAELSVAENTMGINIWIWSFIINTVAVGIISPLGEEIARIQPIPNYENTFVLPRGGGTVEIMYFLPEDISSDQFTHIRISAPASGIWKIRLYNNASTRGNVHLWLPISNFLKTECFFINSDPSVTLTTPATAYGVLAVGAYNYRDNSIYAATGRGPTRFLLVRPYIVAPGVNLNGRSGTSYACALVAGASALMMEWFILRGKIYTANTLTVTTYLVTGATRTEIEEYPNNITGYGMLNLYNSFKNL